MVNSWARAQFAVGERGNMGTMVATMMSRTATLSVAIAGVIVGLFAFSARAADPEPKWTVYIEDGESKVSNVALLPAATPMENYTENLTRICPDMMRERFEDPGNGPAPRQIRALTHPYEPGSQTVAELGKWHGYTVYDVKNMTARHRSIVLEDETGNHRILYTQACWSSATMDSTPKFVTVEGHTVLAYRAPQGGTGNFHLEYYFVFDPKTRLPVRLSLVPIEAKLKEILPEGMAVWKGGGFNIVTLSYNHSVWQKGDGNCCPSAGRVSMKLEIRGHALVVTEAVYDPTNNPEK